MAEPAAGAAFSAIGYLYDRVMAQVPYDEWVDYLTALRERWGQPGPPRRALEVACGTGTLALALARQGAQVLGVDLARGMLAAAQAKGPPAAGRCVWARADMARLGLATNWCDLAICLFDSLNYLLADGSLATTLAGVAPALTADGLFIFDLNTEHALQAEQFTQDDLADSSAVRLRWRSQYDWSTRQSRVEMEFWPPEGGLVHETHVQRAWTSDEVQAAVADAGLELLACYAAFSFWPPRETSDRVYYVCRRAARDGDPRQV